MDLKSFKSQNPPKWGSKLWDFRAEILDLSDNGYSLASICDFLKSNQISAARSSVSAFIKKIKSHGDTFLTNAKESTAGGTFPTPTIQEPLLKTVEPTAEERAKLAELKAKIDARFNS